MRQALECRFLGVPALDATGGHAMGSCCLLFWALTRHGQVSSYGYLITCCSVVHYKREGQKEGLCMYLGFILFSRSIIFQLVIYLKELGRVVSFMPWSISLASITFN